MADRVLFLAWGTPVRGREERATEVFNDALGILGRRQQEGRIDSFDVVLTAPNTELDGYMTIRGTAAQIADLREDPEFMRNTVDAQLAVDGIRHIEGWTGGSIAAQMQLYQEAITALPQHA